MKVYEFIYNSCIYEGAACTESIHKTIKGAQMALDFHKEVAREEWEEQWDEKGKKEFPFGETEYWMIRETEIQE